MVSLHSRSITRAFVVLVLLATAALPALGAADGTVRKFDIAAGDAASALRQFAQQSGVELLYSPDEIAGTETKPVHGEMPPRAALDLMLQSTKLTVTQGRNNGAFAVMRASDPNAPGAAPRRDSPAPSAVPARNNANTRVADTEPIELSPFLVKGETGWDVTETLAGTRLKADVRDIATQIEGFTKDFMEDFALNSFNEALIYSINAENESEYFRENAESATNNLDGGRIRGLGAAVKSRGLFNSSFRSDNYNSGDTIVASGANGVLFGLTSAPGIYDTTPSQAEMKNSARVRLQYSSEDSKRTELNINRVIVPNKLSLRLDYMWQEAETFRKPNHDHQKRITFSTTVRPFRHTQFRASWEEIRQDANLAPPSLAIDKVSLWHLANTVPNSPYTSPQPAYDNLAAVPGNVSATTRIFAAHGANPVFTTGGSAIPPMSWSRSVQLLEPSAPTAFGRPDPDTTFNSSGNHQMSFMDETYFPFDVNSFGNLRKSTNEGYIRRLVLEQRLAPGLHMELAYNQERRVLYVLNNSATPAVFVDPNRYLPAILPGETAPRENPNFGKMYMEFTPGSKRDSQDRKNKRATLSYELKLAERLKASRWGRWLGRHAFAGLLEQGTRYERTQSNLIPLILDDPLIPGVTLSSKTTANWVDASRRVAVRAYLDSPGSATAPALGQDWTYVDANGRPATITGGMDAGWRNSAGKRISTSNQLGLSGIKTESGLFVWQGYFLPDREGRNRLVLTYGDRHDRLWSVGADDASSLGDDVNRSGLRVASDDASYRGWDDANSIAGRNRTKSLVVHPLRWASVFYNEAKTFGAAAAGTLGLTPFGEIQHPGGGTNKDYGVQFNVWQGRMSLRFNHFKSAAGPLKAEAATLQDPIRADATVLERRVMELDPDLPQINVKDGSGLGFGGTGGSYIVKSFQTAEGDEISLNLRPMPNWNIRINASKFKAIDDNIGLEWRAWFAARLPVWETVVAKNGEVDVTGRPLTWKTALADPTNPSLGTLEQYYQNDYVGDTLAYMMAVEGRQTDNARNKRANLVTNYRFIGGKLKGWNVTGAVRWRPPAVIGYPLMLTPSGTKTLDVEHPWTGKRELFTDLGVGYRGRMKWFNRLPFSAQLNVRNALDEGPTRPFKAYTDGSIARLGVIEPRLFIFTFGVDL